VVTTLGRNPYLPDCVDSAFSDTAAADVRALRKRDPLPEPDRTPGAPHSDPFLANRGWHVNQDGVYSLRPEPQGALRPEKDLEAG